jgi:hypothetical protein
MRVCVGISASAVIPAGIGAVLGGSAGAAHLCRDVAAVGQQAQGNQAAISIDVKDSAPEAFAGNQALQGRGGG